MKFLITSLLVPILAYEEVATLNPIRRVVDMLQAMEKKVREEGEEEQDLFEKFQCYCKKNKSELTESIASAQSRIGQLQSQVDEDTAAKQLLDEELKTHKQDRADAQEAVKGAKAQRAKEKAEFDKASGDQGTNIDALGKAIDALHKGLGGGASLLQSPAGPILKNLVQTSQILSSLQRQGMVAFLEDAETAPGTSQIVGILKAMKDEMEKDLGAIMAAEKTAVAQFQELITAKKKEIAAAGRAIEAKSQRTGQLAVHIMEGKNDLQDTVDALSEDERFQLNLRRDCATKEKEMEDRRLTRADELQALAETIRVLNDDDALDLFNATLPKPKTSFLQQVVTKKALQNEAGKIVSDAAKKFKNVNLDLISLHLKGQKVDFTRVLKMVNDMIAVLGKEQKEDDEHRDYCIDQFDVSGDKKRAVQREIQDQTHKKEQADTASANLAREIKALKDGIAALDKSVAEATENRKAEHAEFVKSSAANQAAVDLIAFAKNRLNKFYNPKLYVPPPPRELSEEERVYSALGGDVPTQAPGGIAGTGIGVASFLQVHRAAPPPPPETFGAYAKKGHESNGVMALMDMLSNDVKKDMQVSEVNEKESEKEYQQLMADSQEKRQTDVKSITQKEDAKAQADDLSEQASEGLANAHDDLKATKEFISSLHQSCDFLMENYAFRKKARASETDALKDAKAVLNGADYSLMQEKKKFSKFMA